MAHMLVTHSVDDFDKWKAVFDEVKPMRDEAGELSVALFRDASEPDTITALFEWDSLDNARECLTSALMRQNCVFDYRRISGSS